MQCVYKQILAVFQSLFYEYFFRFIPLTVGNTFKPITCLMEVKVIRILYPSTVPYHWVKIWLHGYIISALSRVEWSA